MLKQNDNTYARIVKLLPRIKMYYKWTTLYFHYVDICLLCEGNYCKFKKHYSYYLLNGVLSHD